ncbi:MAG: hypothetical protein IPF98_02190 [Gemmatimonadetes bacterium]|jgi:divalent metal cation (Fe/Co/Zn/Cd) transporter|nr:hypothetical protein [Gemmatimonadota bacterium]MCC6771049.1 hypothetical protein [Gemmatimonadaceae bacterium]
MRLSLIAGVLLIIAGAFVLYNGGSFTTQKEVLKLGELKLTAEEEHPIAPWVAGAAIVAGLALVVTGARKNS